MRLIDADALEKFLADAEMEATRRRKYVLAGALNTIQGNLRNFLTAEPTPNCTDDYCEIEEVEDGFTKWAKSVADSYRNDKGEQR